MKTTIPYQAKQQRQIKHLLPYFIIAAIVINSFIFSIFVDLFYISVASIADALNLSMAFPPVVRSVEEMDPIRMYANVILVGALLLAIARDYRRKN